MYVEPAGLCHIPSERVSVRLRTVSESSEDTVAALAKIR